jgi:hypothetical protein
MARALLEEIGLYVVARNMSASLELIEKYCGKQSTQKAKAMSPGGWLKDTHALKEK